MTQLHVNLANLRQEKEKLQDIAGQLTNIAENIENIYNSQILQGSQSLLVIKARLQKQRESMVSSSQKTGELQSMLGEIIDIYIKTEKNIPEKISELIESACSLEKEDGKNGEINPETLSYDEYLQYRIDHAVDENTKKLYEKYANKIKIKNDHYEGRAQYDDIWNHIEYNRGSDETDVRGRGYTYFHETGHLIDDKSDWFGSTSTDGRYDFYDKLFSDVENYVDKLMKENGYTNRNDGYDALSDWLFDDPDNLKNGLSDLIRGLTEGKASGRWGHDDYNKKSICHEAFAHFFESGMREDPTKLNYVKEIFPEAYEEFQRMIQDELK